ncbi:MAG: carboxypeptidase regulatory-like domain-containing protein, partial [Bacteroidales bacterium]
MVKNIALSLLLLICSATLFAQRDKDIKRGYSVVGQIVDKSDNQGIPYATIRVLDRKNVVVSVGTADVLGEFKLSLRSPGNYLLKFDAMSYGSDSLSVEVKLGTNEIGIIKLSEGHQLAGVTVTAEKLVMRQELEKLIYDVTKDPDAKRLKMADIMEKIPFMKIDGTDGKLKYLEDRVPTILIDGKPHPMISSQRQFPMRMIKGDVMKDIEIILPHTSENPTDKPIININLEKALPDGFVTEIRTSGNTLKSYRGSIDFISKFDKLYLSFRYSHHG